MNMKKTIAGVMSGAMAVSAMASVVSATEISANNTTEPNSREQIVLSYDLCEYTEKFSDSVVILTTTYEEIPGGYEFTLGKHQIGAKLNDIASYDIVSTQIDATNMDGKASKKLYYSIANNGGAIKDLTNESVAEEDVKDEAVKMLTDDKGNDYAFEVNFAKRDAATNLRGEFIVDNFNVASSRYKDAMGMTKDAAEAKYAQLVAGETEAVSKPNGNTSAAVKPEALKKEKIEHDYVVFGYRTALSDGEKGDEYTETTSEAEKPVAATPEQVILKYKIDGGEVDTPVPATAKLKITIQAPEVPVDEIVNAGSLGAVIIAARSPESQQVWYFAGQDADGTIQVTTNEDQAVDVFVGNAIAENELGLAINIDDLKDTTADKLPNGATYYLNGDKKIAKKVTDAPDPVETSDIAGAINNAAATDTAWSFNAVKDIVSVGATNEANPLENDPRYDKEKKAIVFAPITYYFVGNNLTPSQNPDKAQVINDNGLVGIGQKITHYTQTKLSEDVVTKFVSDATALYLNDECAGFNIKAFEKQLLEFYDQTLATIDFEDADDIVLYYNGTNDTVTLDRAVALKDGVVDVKSQEEKKGDYVPTLGYFKADWAIKEDKDSTFRTALSRFANAIEQSDYLPEVTTIKLTDGNIIAEVIKEYDPGKAGKEEETETKFRNYKTKYGIFTVESVEKYKNSLANDNADPGLLEPLSYLDEKGNDQFKFKTYTLKSTFYVHNVAGWNSKYTGKTTYYTIINTLTKDAGSTVVNYTEGAAYEEIRPMKSALNAPADVFKAISTRKAGNHYYTYPKAVINDVISNNEDVTFTFTSSQYWVDTRKTLEIDYPQYVYYPATSTCDVTYKGLQGYNAHLKGVKCTVSGTPNAEGSKVIIDNPEYGMARATNPYNDKWWYSPYFAQHLYQNSAFPTNHGYNAYGPIFADANDAYSVYGSYNYGNWNSNLFNGGLVINSNWTMQLSDTDAFEWGDSSITFFWNKIKNEYLSGNAKVTNASQFIETMLLYTPVEWYWDKLDVAVGAAIAEGVDSGAGQEDDGEAVEEEPEEVVEEVIEEEPEEEVFEEYVEEEPEEEYVEEEPEEEEEEIEEEEEPEEEEEEVEEEPAEEAPAAVESPKTGNAPIALAVIPVALAAAAVIAKKKN